MGKKSYSPSTVRLDPPGDSEFEAVLMNRKSIRSYSGDAVSLSQISKLLWAAQGATSSKKRTTPSAGGIYPITIYVVWDKMYKYVQKSHKLVMTSVHDRRHDLCSAAIGQRSIENAPLSIVIAAYFIKIMKKYKDRGRRYVLLEAGHVAQNICLMAAHLGLGTVPIGAFSDNRVKRVLNCKENPIYILPVGGLKDG